MLKYNKDEDCIFCAPSSYIVMSTELSLSFRDQFPVTEGHTLLIPRSHRKDFFDLTREERDDIFDMLVSLKTQLKQEFPDTTGFNIGMNCGESSGQTIFHCHIHLIPRRNGDCEDPRGGIRGVIASKQSY